MSGRLSERDRKVIVKCAAGKWPTTGQLQRLCFAGVTADAVRKSLRRLAEAGYLVSVREHRMEEALHGIGARGKEFLEGRGIKAEVSRTPPRQRQHLVGINHLRVAAEALEGRLGYFFACWELAGLGWQHPLIPDAVFSVRLSERMAFAAEYDRGTEPLAGFVRKLASYDGNLAGLRLHAVLVITDSGKRLETISRELRGAEPVVCLVGATVADIETLGLQGDAVVDLVAPAMPRRRLF